MLEDGTTDRQRVDMTILLIEYRVTDFGRRGVLEEVA
jgi:hypothetical protein